MPASPHAQALAVEGTRLAVSGGADGIRLIELDVDGGARTRGRAVLPRELSAGSGSFAGRRLYVAADTGSVAVLDVADPDEPEVLFPSARKMKVSFPK